jgi:xylitol oxidase
MKNWAGNHAYRARRLLEPRSLEELAELVARPAPFRVLGSRHSFNDIADTDGDLISLAGLPRTLEIDARRMTATVSAGARYGDVCEAIDAAGFALHNLASLPHISIAGACATGTHGSGNRSGSLATAVCAISACRTRRAAATSCRASTSSTAPLPWPPSRRSASSEAGSHRSSR